MNTNSTKNNVYLDIGNAKIKIYYQLNGVGRHLSYLTHQQHTGDSLFEKFPKELKTANFDNVYISSVVPNLTYLFEEIARKHWNNVGTLIQHPLKTGIKLAVDNPKEVGSDLVCLGAFVASKVNNGIIVNMGTATTIIQVQNKTFLGVIISAGLFTSYDSLIKNAKKLHDLNLSLTKAPLGKNTDTAISIGILNGHAEMIKGLVARVDKNAKVFLSGGDAQKIADLISEYEYVNEATIEGMKIIGGLNE